MTADKTQKKSFFRVDNCDFGCILNVLTIKQGAVAQLARAIRSHRIGRGFDSHLLHHFCLRQKW